MSTFKVGDKVRVLKTIGNDSVVGKIGAVIETWGNDTCQVSFKERLGPTYSQPGFPYTWCFSEEELAPVTQVIVPVKPPSVADDLRITPKARTILAHLKSGKSITPTEALIVYSQSRLASAIHEIRKAGYVVEMERRTDESGHGYARYTIPQKETVH